MVVLASSVERQAREAEIIGAYPELLREKLAVCGQPKRERNLHRCGSPACPACRRLRGRAEGRRAIEFFAGAAGYDLSLLTVAVGVVRDLWQVAGANQKFTFDCRNLVRAERRDWPGRWGRFRLYGWPEIDVIQRDDMPYMPSKLRGYVAASRPDWNAAGVVFAAHWHLIVNGAGLDRQEVEAAFMDQWPVEGAVDIRPFHLNRSVDENITTIAAYAHQFKVGKLWNGSVMNWWPAGPTADMYAVLSSARWTGKRFIINPVQSNIPRLLTACGAEQDGYEPMAWLV